MLNQNVNSGPNADVTSLLFKRADIIEQPLAGHMFKLYSFDWKISEDKL